MTSQKLKTLRRRLDQLGYKDTLAIESLPLVEKLFVDLVKTIEDLRKTKVELSKKHDNENNNASVDPYRSDNAKLLKENNALHVKVMEQKETTDEVIRELKASLRKTEHNIADLKFLNNQYMHKMHSLEKESKEKSAHIQQLQEKNFHAVVHTPGGRKKNIPFRRQRMEIDCLVPPLESDLPDKSEIVDPFVADLLEIADRQVAESEKQLKNISEEKDIMNHKITNFRQQIEARNEEIERLSKMLDGGRPSEIVALEVKNRANEKMISHLNIQVDILQQQNRDMQQRLDETIGSRDEAHDEMMKLTFKNSDLERQLQNISRKNKLLLFDKEHVVQTADTEMNVAKKELEKSRLELDDLDLNMKHLKMENDRLISEKKELKMRFASQDSSSLRLEELLDKVQEEKRRLTHKVNKLMANEKELVLENERLKHKNGPGKKAKLPSKLDALIRSMEEDRNYYREQYTALQKSIQKNPKASSAGFKSHSPSPRGRISRSTSPVKDLGIPEKLDKKTISHYETIMRILEEERDYFRKEFEKLKAVKRPISPVKFSPAKGMTSNDDVEFKRLTEERNKMKDMLEKFERHMAEVRANVKVLTKERDKLKEMYDEAKNELQQLRREVIRSPRSPKTSLAAQAVMRQVENERNNAIADLQRTTTERDSLRERLRIATETSLTERARLEQKVEDVQASLHMVDVERDEFTIRVNNLKQDVQLLEEQAKEQALQLNDANDEASKERMNGTQMRLLAEEAERSLEEMQRRLNQKEVDLTTSEQKVQHLEERLMELQRLTHLGKEDVSQLQATITAMDREKDSLQMAVDEKTERVALLNEEVIQRERIISDLKVRISQLEAQLEHVNSSLNIKDRELKSLKRQLDSATENLSEISRGKDIALRENRRLQEDLSIMTCENQKINQELQDTFEERESLKSQVQNYMMEVHRAESLLSTKEQERTDLLDQYQALSMEVEQYQSSNHHLESEGSNLRLEIMTKESEIRLLKEKAERLERDIHEHLGAQQAYEIQVSNMTKSISNLEENLRICEDNKQGLSQDINAVRDLCCRLESSKESLQRQLTTTSIEKEQLLSQFEDVNQENVMLQSQISTERESVKNLEDLLQGNREREFQVQLESQEKNVELKQMKDRLALNDSKLQSQSREIASLRTHNVELEGDVERLKRQLTSEKFERERAVQELRRRGGTPPITGDLSRSRSPARYPSPNTSYRHRSSERVSFADEEMATMKTLSSSHS